MLQDHGLSPAGYIPVNEIYDGPLFFAVQVHKSRAHARIEMRLQFFIRKPYDLYGRVNEFMTIEDAIRFLDRHMLYEGSGEFRKYEIRIEFSNGDKVEAFIEAKEKVKEFLDFVARQ